MGVMDNLDTRYRQYLKCLFFMLVVAVVAMAPDVALAQNVFDKTGTRLNEGFRQTRNIVYVIGGLGAIGLGVGAFFGRFRWGWFFSLLGGLAVIALIIEGILFVTDVQSLGGNDLDRAGTSGGTFGPPGP